MKENFSIRSDETDYTDSVVSDGLRAGCAGKAELSSMSVECSRKTPPVFFSLSAVKNYLEIKFSCRVASERSPFLDIPRGWLVELFAEALSDSSYSGSQTLVLDIGRTAIPSPYWAFRVNGRSDEFNQIFSDAINLSLATFDNVCKFVTAPQFESLGGWERIKKWWPEILERAFRKTPFVPLHALVLEWNGKKVGNPYHHVIDRGEAGDLERLRQIYDSIFDVYINESFDHALVYVTQGKFSWGKVPKKWQEKFCEKAFERTPFVSPRELRYGINGKLVKVPTYYYAGNYGEFTSMILRARLAYMNTFDRVLEFVTCKNFQNFGGWRSVPKKWHSVFVSCAVSQAAEDGSSLRKLVFRREAVEISLFGLYELYLKNGEIDLYRNYYERALSRRSHRAVEAEYSGEAGRSVCECPWALVYGDDEEVRQLVALAQKGDDGARFLVVRKCADIVSMLMHEFGIYDKGLRREIFSEAIFVVLKCIDGFDFSKGRIFYAYFKSSVRYQVLRCFTAWKLRLSARVGTNVTNNIYRFKGFSERSPEEVAEEVRSSTRAVENFINLSRGKYSLERPCDDNCGDASCNFCETDDLAGLLASAIEKLPSLRDRVIARQYFGIKSGHGTSLYELRNEIKSVDYQFFPRVVSSVRSFRERVADFCMNPTFSVGKGATEHLLKILEKPSDDESAVNEDWFLGRILDLSKDLGNSGIGLVFSRALSSLSAWDAILLSEITPVLRFDTSKQDDIGEFFGISGERVKQLVGGIVKNLRKILENEYGISADTVGDFIDVAGVGSKWEYVL